MKKILFFSLSLAMVLGLGFTTNGLAADENDECPAAPDIANQLLKDAEISPRYGQGRDGGNYISDVARNMGPRTDFEGVEKCDKEAYRSKVAEFLIDQGAEEIEILFESKLESVVYEGTCNRFGSHEGDELTFVFSNDIERDGDIFVYFLNETQEFRENWGKADYDVENNTLVITVDEEWSNPRPEVEDYITDLEGLVDSIGNDVTVPTDGIEVTAGDITGDGVIDPDASGATWEDNQDGTGTMDITVKDQCGNGIEELGMDDFAIWPPAGNWRTLNDLHGYRSWEVDFNEEGEGDYTALLDSVNEEQVPFDQDWDIQAEDEKIEEGLTISITDVSATLESVEYEGEGDRFGSHDGDELTFVFSNDIEEDGDEITVFLKEEGSFWFPDDGKSSYEIDNNILTLTIGPDTYSSPRPEVGDHITDLEGLVDSIGNNVTVPIDGVEVVKVGGKSLVDTIEVDSAEIDGTDSTVLEDDQQYEFKVNGTWANRAGTNDEFNVDAQYVSYDNWGTHKAGEESDDSNLNLELQVNGGFVDWGNFNSDHTYYYDFEGEGGDVNFRVFDGNTDTNTANSGWYGDNEGSLTVEIYEVW